MTTDQVFDILVAQCGAHESDRQSFRFLWPQCREFRFQGRLGFGGKVYNTGPRIWVDCYREDRTPERSAIIAAANFRLSAS